MKLIEIHVNCPDIETARNISAVLIEERLIACANIHPPIESTYHRMGYI